MTTKTKTTATKTTSKAKAKPAPKAAAGGTITAAELAPKYYPDATAPAKSMRQRMRNNAEAFRALCVEGAKGWVFKNNKTTLAAIDKLMA